MASTSSQTASSCSASFTMAPPSSENLNSSISFPTKWDVFLSYRGKDTGRIFTDHLYNALVRQGIRTFRDDPEVRTGELISDELFQAIQESKIYVTVFSENYASSRWCLDELVEIYNCYETMQRSVIAVYYNIEPSVVRYQSDSFEKAFEKHASRSNITKEQAEKWRLTLKNVAEFSGITTATKRSEADIINEIVEKVVNKIIPKSLPLPKYAVGLDSPVERIRLMLSSDSTKGVMKIGIYGMRGAGKTTLAKSVYNEHHLNFHGSCFLANVRGKDLESLQEKLINDILKSKEKVKVDSVDEGTMLVRARICFAKILVVLDDVEDYTQFDSLIGPFACGSVVIITTTNEDVLVKSDVNPEHRYMLNELNDAESRTLFTRHAFRDAEPDNSLMALSKDILCHAGGLPLALEIFGSSLYKRTEAGWQSLIEKLKRNPHSSIKKRLAISLDAIESDDPMLKKIFIDIACFFIGICKSVVVEILETYYPLADHKIDRLKESCLLTINDENNLGMHGLLQDMGKDIARNDCPDEPQKHSRLWLEEDIHKVLGNQKGTEVIECMIMLHDYSLYGRLRYVPRMRVFSPSDHFSKRDSFSVETFKTMTKLRFLYLNGVNLTGSFYQTFEDLRWLCWTSCPLQCLPSNFLPAKLVTLLLPHSNMRTLWDISKVAPVFENLKTLNMAYSKILTTTPDFTKLPCLETLNFRWCESLQEVHISIESLARLVLLDFCGCENLRSLPDSICNLRALKSLNVDHCISLEALPVELGNIESLKQLSAAGLSISKLPHSIGKFSKLIELSLGCVKDLYRSHHCARCKSLETRSSYSKLEILPDTICGLRALQVLNIISYSSFKALPMDLGNIKSLEKINAAGLNISNLPNSIGFLGNLVELILCHNKSLETLPHTICHLRGLKVLNIDHCSSLQALPTDLGNIESLEYLNAGSLNVSKLPNSIGKLSKLIRLDLFGCKNLKTLPDTICNLGSLKILDISSCENLGILPDKLWKLTRLTNLYAHNATMLNKIPDIESSQIALSLETLSLSDALLTALPSGIGQLSKLTYLRFDSCRHLLIISELPPNLTRLDASGCNMESIPNLSNLKHLKTLNLESCENLKEIQGFEGLTSLESIDVRYCYSLHEDTFTERFFQRNSGHQTKIYGHCIPRWFSLTRGLWSSVSLLLPVDSWTNFLGLIMCFDFSQSKPFNLEYSVKTATDFMNFRHQVSNKQGIFTVNIPRSIFCVRDGDDKIELKSNFRFSGIHLLYKTEITMIDE